jgi:hypothetical protein
MLKLLDEVINQALHFVPGDQFSTLHHTKTSAPS